MDLSIATLHAAYRRHELTPTGLMRSLRERILGQSRYNAWIYVLDEDELEGYLQALDGCSPDDLPLFGVPFAIKDNIDLAGVPTTAACPDYAYTPGRHAFVVELLIRQGAIPLGKTNLDQFATGLVGTRSPYGAAHNAFDPEYIAGGSSSGSALAVALGHVSFALGTDTAGSGRVPAAFNNLVGVKPSRGLLSCGGVVPACRSLDCVSIFALQPDDAVLLTRTLEVHDPADPWSRRVTGRRGANPRHFTFGVPVDEQLEFFGNGEYQQLFRRSVADLEAAGGRAVTIDFAPFREAARLLYEGPWLAERYLVVKKLLQQRPESLLEVTRGIIARAEGITAADAFLARYRLAELQRAAERVWQQVDLLLTPTAGTHYRLEEVAAEPVFTNSRLGYYTNYMNLLDCAAVAVPAGFTADGLPFGVTLQAPAFSDDFLLAVAHRFHGRLETPLGAGDITRAPGPAPTLRGRVEVAVCGAHLEGEPLNHQLTDRGGFLLERTTTASVYRLYALAGGPPLRPGLVREEQAEGHAIQVEVWSLPEESFGSFVAGIPEPLGMGRLELADGRWVSGFICEPRGIDGAEDISAFGGWRAWLAARNQRSR